MNKEHNRIISNFKNSLSALLLLYRAVKNDKDNLYKEKLVLLEDIENMKKANEELQEKYDTLKFAKDLSFLSEDTNETKDKLGNIVREIDKCISLLNK